MNLVPTLVVLTTFAASCGLWGAWLLSPRLRRRLLPPRRAVGFRVDAWVTLVVVVLTAAQFVWVATTWFGSPSAPSELPTTGQLVAAILRRTFVLVCLLGYVLVGQPTTANWKAIVPRSWWREGAWGAVGFLAAVAPVQVVLWATLPLRSEQYLHQLLQLLRQNPTPQVVALIAVSAVVLAPMLEELMYRVVLQTWLVERLGAVAGIAVTAVVFAGVHGPLDALALLPLAVLLGWLFHRTGSYFAVVKMHALFNTYNLALTLLDAWCRSS